jgi:hypothetical protein
MLYDERGVFYFVSLETMERNETTKGKGVLHEKRNKNKNKKKSKKSKNKKRKEKY